MAETIVTELQSRRVAEGISNNQMARKLGLDPTHWSRICRGKQAVGAKLIFGALRVYPDLANVLARDSHAA